MSDNSLKLATDALNDAILAIGGEEAAIEACERMYNATFRSEPFPLGSIEEWDTDEVSLYIDAALPIYLKATNTELPVKPDYDADEHEFDNYYMSLEAIEGLAEEYMRKHYPEFKITKDTLIVTLCNYKGEGEGEALYMLNKHLPVFKSKRESFFQVN